MYFGESISRLDDKGRVTVPRRIRETMEANEHLLWYMTRGFDRSIFLFHRDAWKKIREQAGQGSPIDANVLDFRRLFFSSVAEVRPDAQGRIPVPQHLQDHAGIDKEVVLIGVDDHLELWSKENWQAYLERMDAEYKRMAAGVFSRVNGGETDTEKGGLANAC